MVYQVLCNLLTQMHDVLGQKRLSVRAFYDVLAAGLSAEEVGVLPATQDARRTRGARSRAAARAICTRCLCWGQRRRDSTAGGRRQDCFTREDLLGLSEEGRIAWATRRSASAAEEEV